MMNNIMYKIDNYPVGMVGVMGIIYFFFSIATEVILDLIKIEKQVKLCNISYCKEIQYNAK